MNVLRSMVVWMTAGGLVLGSVSMAWGQQGAGQGNLPGTGLGQTQGSSGQGTGRGGAQVQQPSLGSASDDTVRDPLKRTEEEMDRVRNGERQKKLIEDTEKLLALANELKLDVDKTSKDTLSLDVIRKADEIEKLAHSVKEKMKGT